MFGRKYMPSAILLCSCLLLQHALVVCAEEPQSTIPKKLVLFAGPHKAASLSVQTFFYNHASGVERDKILEGLDGWLWPNIPKNTIFTPDGNPVDPMRALDALITQAKNATATSILIKELQNTWNWSKYGMIMGTPEFDKVGTERFKDKPRVAVAVIRSIAQALRLGPEDIHIVINYRTPRFDQWLSLWKEQDNFQDDKQHYRKFLCKGNKRDQLEFIDTAMNPFQMADEFRKESWAVYLVDMKGVEEQGHDISHAIACEVLDGTKCDNGYVRPANTTYRMNYGGDNTLNWQGTDIEDNFERLFQERDCNYQADLEEDDGFQILYRHSVWEQCRDDRNSRKGYEALKDPQLILDSLRSHKDCADSEVDLESLLANQDDVPNEEEAESAEEVEEEEVSSSIKDAENSEVDEEDGASESSKKITMPPSPESDDDLLPWEKKERDSGLDGNVSSREGDLVKESKKGSPFLTIVLVLTSFGFGVYQLQFIRRVRSQKRAQNMGVQMQSFTDAGSRMGKYSDDTSAGGGEDGFDDFMSWTQEFRDEEE